MAVRSVPTTAERGAVAGGELEQAAGHAPGAHIGVSERVGGGSSANFRQNFAVKEEKRENEKKKEEE